MGAVDHGDKHDDVLEFLRELGASDEQLAAAANDPLPSRMAVEIVLGRSFTLRAAEVAERLGVTTAEVTELARSNDMWPVGTAEPTFSDVDVELFRLAQQVGTSLNQVVVAALSRVADAAVAQYVQSIEADLLAASGATSDLGLAEASAQAGELAIRLSETMGSLFLHQLQGAIRWQRTAQEGLVERRLARLAIGFADLVGFTSLTRRLDAGELVSLVASFETTAYEVAVRNGGRIVKHVGDEVMFVALDAATAVRIAADLVAAFSSRSDVASALTPRAGVAFGDVLTLHGDFYGTVVNLASRVTDEAIPGEVLVDDAAARSARQAGLEFVAAGRRMLKGFDEPETVYSLLDE